MVGRSASTVGWKCALRLADVAIPLGVQGIIYDRRAWGFGYAQWRPYTGPHEHRDHVHVEQNLWGATYLTLPWALNLLRKKEFCMTDEQWKKFQTDTYYTHVKLDALIAAVKALTAAFEAARR